MRLYNDCPDDELKAVMDHEAAIRAEAKSLGIHITYFPMEGKYAACTSIDSDQPYRDLSGFHHTLGGALEDAKEKLRELVRHSGGERSRQTRMGSELQVYSSGSG